MPTKLMPLDIDVIRDVVDWGFLTVDEIIRLGPGRNIVAQRRRLQALSPEPRSVSGKILQGLGYLQKVDDPENRWGPPIWYPRQLAYDFALRHGFISQPIIAKDVQKTNIHLVHHRKAVLHRFAVLDHYGPRLHASSATYNRQYGSTHSKKRWYCDWMFYLHFGDRYPLFFVELENIREHSPIERPGGTKSYTERMQKAVAFAEFCISGELAERFHYPQGRMMFLLPTARQAENCAEALRYMSEHPRDYKLHAEVAKALGSRMFWVTDTPSAIADPAGSIFMTPRDYETTRYSLDQA